QGCSSGGPLSGSLSRGVRWSSNAFRPFKPGIATGDVSRRYVGVYVMGIPASSVICGEMITCSKKNTQLAEDCVKSGDAPVAMRSQDCAPRGEHSMDHPSATRSPQKPKAGQGARGSPIGLAHW